MRKVLLSLIAVALALVSTPVVQAQHTVTPSWQEAPGFPACSSATPALTASCGLGWTLTHTAGSAVVVTDATPATLPWTVLTFTIPVPVNNTAPTWSLTLVGTYLDAAGAALTTAQATCGTSNTPAPCAISGVPNTVPGPINFTVVVK